jgi:ATP-dependent protease HslVU (ClpYQ) peptidase subunit
MNFSGQVVAANQTAENRRLTQDTSLMVLAGAVLIAFAIMSKK